jgi:uncharacterized phiE125 gp8 family phage protein
LNLRVITAPAQELVSIETMKSHLRVDGTEEDPLIQSYIHSACELGEGLARRAFLTQTLELVIDTFPADGILKLPRPPLQSVTSVKYMDVNGNEYTWTDYAVDARSEPGVVIFRSIPADALLESGAVAVRFVAGYGLAAVTVPAMFTQGVMLSVAHWYENREGAIEIPADYKPLFLADRGSWF